MNCPADIKDEKEGSMKRTSKLDDAICRGNHIWILGNLSRKDSAAEKTFCFSKICVGGGLGVALALLAGLLNTFFFERAKLRCWCSLWLLLPCCWTGP